MLKLPLKPKKRFAPGIYPWLSCLPFVENSRARLIHRPRAVATFHRLQRPHIVVEFWCGMQVSSSKHLTFLPVPPESKLVCHRCEEKAVANSLPSTDELTGKHVHKGACVAVPTCCGRGRGLSMRLAERVSRGNRDEHGPERH